MKDYIIADPWKIIESSYDAHLHPNTESLMSLGNGRMGQRANYAETYTGESLLGNYIAGIYYPDKTRVGWWKNGYPEYFAKVLNSVNWAKLRIYIDDEEVDLYTATILSYHRELDMQAGILKRKVVIKTKSGKSVNLSTERFMSIADQESCYLRYTLSSDQSAEVLIHSILDFNVRNQDANYDEDFWTDRKQGFNGETSYVSATTKRTAFEVTAACITTCHIAEERLTGVPSHDKGQSSSIYTTTLSADTDLTLVKKVAITSSFYYDQAVEKEAINKAASLPPFDEAFAAHSDLWRQRWDLCDIQIEGDVKAQQGIRFNIFQLYQTYSGEDARLNIGPKGFTGEKYGGSTYWDTEAYCLPFYMSTAPPEVARNLLVYRHNHLPRAIENAEKLGFKNGAALYPMVTINGEECHNEWEITFEEIHRNGAIAYAIYNYIKYTGDKDYITSHGLEVLIGISRFWAQRVHLSPASSQYVMLGVTGPNEYENNVDNNWYTNYIARWCLTYSKEIIHDLKAKDLGEYQRIVDLTNLTDGELDLWSDIIARMYLPYDEDKGIYVQHDGYLHNEDITVKDLHPEDRPLNQNWSWDRILRSPFIKQADVLQGIYFFEDDFSSEEIKRNFDYYEPRTVHESSLSPCVHAILAASIGEKEKAYEMYVRTARLDLDDYNNDTEDGCHITSMAGTWMSIVQGFAGMRVVNDMLSFSPFLPDQWTSYSFHINFRGTTVKIHVLNDEIKVHNLGNEPIDIIISSHQYNVAGQSHQSMKI